MDINKSKLVKLGALLVLHGFPSRLLKYALAQIVHESGNFTNNGSLNLNNYTGIKYTASGNQKNSVKAANGYAQFSSDNAWAVDYIRILSRGSNAPINQLNDVDFVSSLKANGYFEDTQSNYHKRVLSISKDTAALLPAVYASVVVGGVASAAAVVGACYYLKQTFF